MSGMRAKKMTVLFYGGALEQTAGERSFEAPYCSNVRDLVSVLGRRFGEGLEKFLLGNETCFFLVNGKGLMMTGGLDTKLADSDRIEVLPFTEAG